MKIAQIIPWVFLTLSACQSLPSSPWHWERIEAGLPRQVTTLAVAADSTNPDQLWLGYYAPGGLAHSLNGGQTWTSKATELGDNPIFDLLFIPSSPGEGGSLWAAARDGLFYSLNGGDSWQLANNGLPPTAVLSLAADAGGRVYAGLDNAGIYHQTEHGWQNLPFSSMQSEGEVAILSLAVSPDGQLLYAGTAGQGLFASRDNGRSWINTYPQTYAPNLALNPATPQTAVASLRDRLVRTHDGGKTWHTLPLAWAQEEIVSLLWLTDGVLAAGTGQGRLYRSLDNGETWLEGGTGLPRGGILDLTATEGWLLAATWTGLYASKDMGTTWRYLTPDLGSPHPNPLLATENGLLLGTQAGLFIWQPDNRHWMPAPGDFPPGGLASLAADPLNPPVLYAGTSGDGLYRSDNGGAAWQRVPTLGVGIPAVAVDPQDSRRVYLLAAWERVYESRDGGQSWQARWDGLGDTLETVCLAVDPVKPLVYVGAEDRLYRRDAGRPWELAAPSLAGQTILALLAQPRPSAGGSGSVLYIGTTRGVYRSLDGGLTVQGAGTTNQGYIPPAKEGVKNYRFSFFKEKEMMKPQRLSQGWGNGLENVSVSALLVDPGNPAHLLAGTAYAGVYQSLDWGYTWHPIGPAELAEEVVKSLAWGPEGELFVAATHSVWAGRGR